MEDQSFWDTYPFKTLMKNYYLKAKEHESEGLMNHR